jgi:hypothetical protein
MSKNYVIIGGSSDVALSYFKHINDISVGIDKASVIAQLPIMIRDLRLFLTSAGM